MVRTGRSNWRRRTALVRHLLGAALLLGMPLSLATAVPRPAYAEPIETSGEVYGADVEGTIWLTLDPTGGDVSGRIEMDVTFDCRGKTRSEHHVLDITKGKLDGDRLTATAVYVDRSGLPKDELSRCKSAYESYLTREDSRRLVGTVDAEGARASGTLGEYRPTVSWRVSWAEPAAPAGTSEEPAAEPAGTSEEPAVSSMEADPVQAAN